MYTQEDKRNAIKKEMCLLLWGMKDCDVHNTIMPRTNEDQKLCTERSLKINAITNGTVINIV